MLKTTESKNNFIFYNATTKQCCFNRLDYDKEALQDTEPRILLDRSVKFVYRWTFKRR